MLVRSTLVFASFCLAGCSLLAPSDDELLGGAKDAGVGAAGSGGTGAGNTGGTGGGGDAVVVYSAARCLEADQSARVHRQAQPLARAVRSE